MLELEPREVFDWFYTINQIPRESGNEEAISNFLVDFAKERNLEVTRDEVFDEVFNVIIKKPASPGYESAEPVIIQGHMDMVCVKTDNSNHDFTTDAIEMVVEGNTLRAKETTLGADDGIVVAMQLALLDGDYAHPSLEILITTNEETTMAGAAAVQAGQLQGTRLLNIDGEEEGVFQTSCAGGTVISSHFSLEKEAYQVKGYRLMVHGLKGGHSGMEINQGRGNANLLLFRVLRELAKKEDLQLAQVSGGSRDNVIPSQAVADVVGGDFTSLQQGLKEIEALLKKEYATSDPDLALTLEEIAVEAVYPKELTNRLLNFFALLPNGVQALSQDVEGLVQTSLNNAVLLETDQEVVLQTSLRSSMGSQLEELAEKLAILAQQFGARSERNHDYPSWDFEPNSPLREQCLHVYEEVVGRKASYDAVHAGLECGFLKGALPDCDMISYGPNIYDVHSTKERMDIDSVARTWAFTKALLAEMK